jgi:hypothetical protein
MGSCKTVQNSARERARPDGQRLRPGPLISVRNAQKPVSDQPSKQPPQYGPPMSAPDRRVPVNTPVYMAGGRWGKRRGRVSQFWATVRSEDVHASVVRKEGVTIATDDQVSIVVRIARPDGSRTPWTLQVAVRRNPIWKGGRLFLLCPRCSKRAARLYVPLSGLEPRCRRCWGLNYESQSRS